MTQAAAASAPPTHRRYQAGARRLREELARSRREALTPPEPLSLSEWADRHAYLSAETSADAGKFKAFAYQNGIMDAVTDPSVNLITVMKSARVGYTKILDHIVGYFIAHDPAPILVVQPRVEDSEDYSKTEIAPMLRDTPVLRAVTGDLKGRDSNQTILKRMFRNGSSLALVGANAPGGFRRITARIIAFDEVDGYPEGGAGDDGDQIRLGMKRGESFWNRKGIFGSTPLVDGRSRIQKLFKQGDQRYYNVPCPHCGVFQVLKWENLRWDRDEAGNHQPETAYFRCEANGCRVEEHDKPAMIDAGQWVGTQPFKGHASFHIWAAYSLFPNAAWGKLAAEWLDVYKDPLERKTFVNLALGLPYADAVEVADPDRLRDRAEQYNWETLPAAARFVTVGVDKQDDRLEVTFVAWGANEEAWVARHEVLDGDTAEPAVWHKLDRLLVVPCETDDGRKLMPQAVCVDSQGHRSEVALDYCRVRKRRRIYAIKGAGNTDPSKPRMIWPKTPSRTKNSGDRLYLVGVDTAKDDLSSRLAIVPHENAPTPRAIHFPVVGLSADYYEQLTAEHAVVTYVNGRPRRRWDVKKLGTRNEAWDCLVYALAARLSLPIKLTKAPSRAALKAEAEAEAAMTDDADPVEPAGDEERAPPPARSAPPADEPQPPKPPRAPRRRWGAYR